MAHKSYKIRRVSNGKNRMGKPFINWSLTVPAEIVEIVPEGTLFEVELTESGLLYRIVEPQEDLPEWAKNGNKKK